MLVYKKHEPKHLLYVQKHQMWAVSTQESSCSLVVMPDNKKIGILILYAVNVV
jgi:hypothetical protein